MAKQKITKRDKINNILDILNDWLEAYEGEATTEEDYEDVCKDLVKSIKVLKAHKTVTHTPIKDHVDGDYYVVKIGDMEVRKVRCKKCGTELDPKGFNRHVNRSHCKKLQAKMVKDDQELKKEE